MFQTAFESISVLVVCMAVGFAAKKGRVIKSQDIPGMSGVILNITLPCLMLMSLQREFEAGIFKNSLIIMAFAALMYLGCLAVSFPVTKMLRSEGGEKAVFMFAFVFSNNGFMGIPIINAMLGQEAMFYAAMVNSVFIITLFTVGDIIMKDGHIRGKVNIRSLLLNKIIAATVLGLLFFLFSVKIPEIIGTGLRMMGNMTTPLSMIVTGAMLAENDLKAVFSGWKIYVVAAFRLLILPLLVFFILRFIITDELAITILMIVAAMPVAVVAAIFAAENGKEPHMASKLVFITTVLSIFTIPLLVYITSAI